jgi:hypothetical protein
VIPSSTPRWDRKYWATYKVLDILQKVFYRSNPAREAFVEMCEDSYVQKMTFDSYLYKTVVPGGCPAVCCAVLWYMGAMCVARLWQRCAATRGKPKLAGMQRSTESTARLLMASILAAGVLMCVITAAAAAAAAGNPLDDAKLLFNTVASIVRANALRSNTSKSVDVSFGSKATEEFQQRVGASA